MVEGKEIKILIVEPDFIKRKGLVSILSQADDMYVVGEAVNAEDALAFVKENEVNVIITELWVENEKKSLLAVLRKENLSYIKIIVLTSSLEAKHLFEAMRLGAHGYLLKSLDSQIWLKVIRSVAYEEPMASQIACEILKQFADEQFNCEIDEKVKALSKREREVLRFLALGLTNQEIGYKMNISANTVKNHLQRIGNKLETNNRTQLVSFALRNGLK